MKKIISFSLWGNNPKYTIGAIKNIKLAQKLMPDWTCRFYVDNTVADEILFELKNNGAEIYKYNTNGDWFSMFWRFLPASEDNVECMISRDCDSRISEREVAAIKEWLESDKIFHIMRDHPYHSVPILGGMWGIKRTDILNMKELIKNYSVGNYWQTDQEFLKDIVYPIVKNFSLVHDPFFEKIKFPTERIGKEYVGKAFNDDDSPCNPEHEELL